MQKKTDVSEDYNTVYVLDTSRWIWTPFKQDDFTLWSSWSYNHLANLYNNEYILMMQGTQTVNWHYIAFLLKATCTHCSLLAVLYVYVN